MIIKSISPTALTAISTQFSNRLLGISFIPLHYSIWITNNIAFSKTLLLLHIGLFLLWQPYLNHKTQIRTNPSIIILLSLFGIIYLGGYWVQSIWVVFLIGILSSYRLRSVTDKLAYYIAISYLLIELFGGLVPKNIIMVETLHIDMTRISYITSALSITLLIIPFKTDSIRNYSADLLYSLIAVSLTFLIGMTTAIWMVYGSYEYYSALIYTCISVAFVLIIFSLMFKPSSGLGALSQLKDRYLLNLGTPFESFLLNIAALSTQSKNPNDFLEKSFEQLRNLEWVAGFNWNTDQQQHQTGDTKVYPHILQFDNLNVTLYSRHQLGPSMLMHARLLIQIISIFYSLKNREVELAKRAHMEAIHETGARITHDIKNLLQSMNLMLSTVPALQPIDSNLFTRNIALFSERLHKTLYMLQNPQQNSNEMMPLRDWLKQIEYRCTANRIDYTTDIQAQIDIPYDAFNTVIDNLIDNAEKKRLQEPNIRIALFIQATNSAVKLDVTDSGSIIEPEIAKALLNTIVKSSSGFGIGLYQANKQIQAYGYRLFLSSNHAGCVRFSMRKE